MEIKCLGEKHINFVLKMAHFTFKKQKESLVHSMAMEVGL